jgi:hypothetical protein
MLLDPINSITSVNFYKKISGQGPGRTCLYMLYLGLIYGIFATIWFRAHFLPVQQKTFNWLETSVPTITYANGRLSTPTNTPVTVRHPELEQVAFTIDTGRTEPVTSQMMQDGKVTAYVTSGALYVLQPGGRLEVYDFSKTPGSKSAVVDAKFWQQLAQVLRRVEYPMVFTCCFLGYAVWKGVTALFFSLIAVLINGMGETGLGYKPLFNLSAYAQTLVLVLTALLMIVSGFPPFLHILNGGMNMIAVMVTSVYLWLAIRKNAVPQPQNP